MKKGRAQFVGAAGQFYVAYGLAVRQINVGLTVGNAPSVDLLASSEEGSMSVAIQVKTSRSAHRPNRYGYEGYEWHVGKSSIGKWSNRLVYAFVDLQENESSWKPKVFFVPSLWVSKFVKPDWSRFMYFLPIGAEELTFERWDILEGVLRGSEDAQRWMECWPEDRLVQWGE